MNLENHAKLEDAAEAIYSQSLSKIFILASGILVFSGLTFVGAMIRIPLKPVPITLQTLFVLLAGAVLGSSRGSVSQSIYVLLGIVGVPVFASFSSGPGAIMGPTGGYLLGFILAPALIGKLMRRSASASWSLIVFSIGAVTILFAGTLHLAVFYTQNLTSAVRVGLLPFLPGELLKIFAATSIYKSYSALSRMRKAPKKT